METKKKYVLKSLNIDNFKIDPANCLEDKELIKEFTCYHCKFLLGDPKICLHCGNLICQSCIEAWLKDNSSCIMCNKEFKFGYVAKAIMNAIKCFSIKCPNRSCLSVVKLDNLHDHLNFCKYTSRIAKCLACFEEINCTNEEREIKDHVNVCSETKFEVDVKLLTCNFCKKDVMAKNLTDHVKNDCSNMTNLMSVMDDEIEKKLNILKEHFNYELESIRVEQSYYKESFYEKSEEGAGTGGVMRINESLKAITKEKIDKNLDGIKLDFNNKIESLAEDLNEKLDSVMEKQKFLQQQNNNFNQFIKSSNNTVSNSINIFTEHNKSVFCIIQLKWSKDDTTIVSGSKDKTLKIWNVETGDLLSTLSGHLGDIYCLIQMKWYHDDTTIISGSKDKSIKIWDLNSGLCLKTLTGHDKSVCCLIQMKWNRDNTTIISGSEDNTIKIWNIEEGTCLTTLVGHKDYVLCLKQIKWIKNDYTVISGSPDGTLKLWNLENGVCITTLTGHTNTVRCVLQLKWSNRICIISAGGDNTFKIWDVEKECLLKTLNGVDHYVECMIKMNVSNNSTTIITGGLDKTIKLWNAKTGLCLKSLMGHSDYVLCLLQMKWNKNQNTVVSGSSDGTIRIWN